MSESLLDFYRRHGISPVRQDIRNLDAHFARRAALYRHLGLLPKFLSGRTVLEIGPGSGFNSVYTASLKPSRYVLVEGNPRGVEDIGKLFADYPDLAARIEVVTALADHYRSDEPFDFVLCEGMVALAGVPDPQRLLRRIAENTGPDGVLVITCIDAVSDLSETLRRLIAHLVIDPSRELDDHVRELLPILSPHLSSLAGMSRPHDDWIIDNLLNPASIGPLLSIPDAVTALADEFDIFGASPHFLTDWRWYKSIAGADGGFNQLAIDSYWANVHNLLDYRHLSPARDPVDNHRLYELCVSVRDSVREYETRRDRRVVARILDLLGTVASIVQTFSPSTSDAIVELHDLLGQASLDGAAVAASRSFGPWFGRGQQYLSFSRRSTGAGV